MEMGNLSKKNHDAWRRGHVLYLERVFEGSLSKANRILRLIGLHMHDLNMIPRQTVYHKWGSCKNCVLQFSKSGTRRLEEAYSRHYVWNRSQEKKHELIDGAMPEQARPAAREEGAAEAHR